MSEADVLTEPMTSLAAHQERNRVESLCEKHNKPTTIEKRTQNQATEGGAETGCKDKLASKGAVQPDGSRYKARTRVR